MLRSARVLAVAAMVALAAPALGGSTFRLEIGQPIAAGANTKSNLKAKNAVLVVRPLACDDTSAVRISGTAEGLVDGVRRSVALTLVPLDAAGVHAITRQWPDGAWVLNLTAVCPGRNTTAGVLVPLTDRSFAREKIRSFESSASPAEVDAALRDAPAAAGKS